MTPLAPRLLGSRLSSPRTRYEPPIPQAQLAASRGPLLGSGRGNDDACSASPCDSVGWRGTEAVVVAAPVGMVRPVVAALNAQLCTHFLSQQPEAGRVERGPFRPHTTRRLHEHDRMDYQLKRFRALFAWHVWCGSPTSKLHLHRAALRCACQLSGRLLAHFGGYDRRLQRGDVV